MSIRSEVLPVHNTVQNLENTGAHINFFNPMQSSNYAFLGLTTIEASGAHTILQTSTFQTIVQTGQPIVISKFFVVC